MKLKVAEFENTFSRPENVVEFRFFCPVIFPVANSNIETAKQLSENKILLKTAGNGLRHGKRFKLRSWKRHEISFSSFCVNPAIDPKGKIDLVIYCSIYL